MVFPKLCLVASYSVLCKMGHGVISLLWNYVGLQDDVITEPVHTIKSACA